MKRIKSSELINTPVQLDTQTVYQANGDINIYPCAYEQDKAPITTAGPIRKKGKFVLEENGAGYFKPYKIGSGETRELLFATAAGELTATNRNYIVRLKLSRDMSSCRMMETLLQQINEICDYVKNNL